MKRRLLHLACCLPAIFVFFPFNQLLCNRSLECRRSSDTFSPFVNAAKLSTDFNLDPLVFRVEDEMLETAGPLVVTFTTNAFDDLAALQMALQFDTAYLHFDSVEVLSALPIAPGDFGLFNVENGEIRLVWSTTIGQNLSAGAEIFRLHFNVQQTGGQLSDYLELDETVLTALAFTSALEQTTLELEFFTVTNTSSPVLPNRLELLQNQPNPFKRSTTIGFVLPAACRVQLRVLDLSGRVLYQTDKHRLAGYQEETIALEVVPGLLYYELLTPYGTVVRKMVQQSN